MEQDARALTVRVYELLRDKGPMTARAVAAALGVGPERMKVLRVTLCTNGRIFGPVGLEGGLRTYGAVPGARCTGRAVYRGSPAPLSSP